MGGEAERGDRSRGGAIGAEGGGDRWRRVEVLKNFTVGLDSNIK